MENKENITKLVESYIKKNNNLLIGILEDIQKHYNYLPEDVLREISKHLNIPLREVFGVSTFYKAFSLKPRGKHLICVCLGTACHVRNSSAIVEVFENELGIKRGQTTPDNEFTLETVNCLGACALGPVVVSDGKYFSNVKIGQVKSIITKTLKGLSEVDIKDNPLLIPLNVYCPKCNHTLMDANNPIDGYPSIRVNISFGNKSGWFLLSSLYGSYNTISEHERPVGIVGNYFCPHCKSELISKDRCPECGTNMASMSVKGGGMVFFCPKKGCKGHLLNV